MIIISPKFAWIEDLKKVIVDNLTTDDSKAPLSARQGKVLNEKIEAAIAAGSNPPTPPLNPADYIVNSLAGDEINKAPTVHVVKEALNKKADLVAGKVPLNQLPQLTQPAPTIKLVGGKGIIINKSNDNYIISVAPSKEDIIKKFKNGKKVNVPNASDYTDIYYADNLDLFVAVASEKVVTSNDNGKTWKEVALPVVGPENKAIAYSNKLHKFCIVGKDTDKAIISSDGITFTTSTLPKKIDYVDVVSVDNIGATGAFIVLSSSNPSIMVSTNGVDWVEKTINVDGSYNAISYNSNDKRIVVVGNDGQIAISKPITDINSIEFEDKKLDNTSIELSDVCYSSSTNKYCAVTYINTNKAYIYACSGSGANGKWKEVTLPISSTWSKVAYIPFYKAFVILSKEDLDNRMVMSVDEGNTWDVVNLPSLSHGNYTSIAYSNKINIACITANISDSILVIGSNDSAPPITYSTIKWVKKKIQVNVTYQTIRFYDVCWSPELHGFYALAQHYNSPNWGIINMFVSPDGITWTLKTLPINDNWRNICWSPELHMFCVVSVNGEGIISPDGITWTKTTLSNINNLRGICWSPELRMFCAVSASSDKIAISPNGIRWTLKTLPSNNNWQGICWSPELRLFCVVNNSNKSITSPDGITWTERTLPISTDWQGICWSPELRLFCAIGYNSDKVITSSDGITWTERILPINSGWYSICWSSELRKFCAVGNINYGDNILLGISE